MKNSLRQFSRQERKLVSRSQRKYREEVQKIVESLLASDNSYEWVAFSNPRCKWCCGRGLLEISHPKNGIKKVPCDCSLNEKAKTLYFEQRKERPVWKVIRGGVTEEVFVKKGIV